MEKDVYFYSSGNKIAGILGYPENFRENESYPGIVINHGYSGNKEEYNSMARELNIYGYFTLQFDSRGCGESDGIKGRMMCSTEWVEDADSAITFLTTVAGMDRNRIGFTGCSMGGALTMYMSANYPRIKCSVAMSPLADGFMLLREAWIERNGEKCWEDFVNAVDEDNSKLVVSNASRFVTVPYALCMLEQDEKEFLESRVLDKKLVKDVPLESVRNSFFLFKPMEYCYKINIPIMLIHGDADFIVPIKHSQILYDKINSKKELVTIKGAPHPLPMSPYKEEVFEHTVRWFNENL